MVIFDPETLFQTGESAVIGEDVLLNPERVVESALLGPKAVDSETHEHFLHLLHDNLK